MARSKKGAVWSQSSTSEVKPCMASGRAGGGPDAFRVNAHSINSRAARRTPDLETPAKIISHILRDFFSDLKDRREERVRVWTRQTSEHAFNQCPGHLCQGWTSTMFRPIQNVKIHTNHIRTNCMSWGVVLLPPKSSRPIASNQAAKDACIHQHPHIPVCIQMVRAMK
jgi:hypothetical protein